MEVLRCAPAAGVDIAAVSREACDLAALGAAEALIRASLPDAVINAAAYTAVDKAETEPDQAEAVNAAAPAEMARACAALGVPLVQYSTDYVFNGAASRPYRETDMAAPLGVYGQTKLDGEKSVAAAGCVYAVIRMSWVFSAHGSNFVTTMLRLSKESARLRIVADQIGKPTPAAPAAAAGLVAARALREDPALSGLYHFAGDAPVSWADFARVIFTMAGRKTVVDEVTSGEYQTPARRPLNSVLDTQKIGKTFGLAAPSWRDGLAAVLEELGSRAAKELIS